MPRFLVMAVVAILLVWPAAAADTIYLTFDDGPLRGGTANVLDVLEAEAVPAAFFMVGLHAAASKATEALVDRVRDNPLLTLANHSYTHGRNKYRTFYADPDGVMLDMLRASLELQLVDTPVPARMPGRNVFRLPNISRDDRTVGAPQWEEEAPDFDALYAAGFYIYGWDKEWFRDLTGKPMQTVEELIGEIEQIFSREAVTKSGHLILLMHDQMFQDKFEGKETLTALIQGLAAKGYVFGSIGDYDK